LNPSPLFVSLAIHLSWARGEETLKHRWNYLGRAVAQNRFT
jgi:hypothetical protein